MDNKLPANRGNEKTAGACSCHSWYVPFVRARGNGCTKAAEMRASVADIDWCKSSLVLYLYR